MKMRVYTDANGAYRWAIQLQTGEVIAESPRGYENIEHLITRLRQLQKAAGNDNLFTMIKVALVQAKGLVYVSLPPAH